MDQAIREALDRGGVADITTTGRKTGLPRRKEIYFHSIDGNLYLTGKPGFKRDWQANIGAHPEFTLHLKRGVNADVPVVGEFEPDPAERGRVLLRARVDSWGADPDEATANLGYWVDTAPFIRFHPVEHSG
jgi:F420H(2)-dependent quinone reductase